MDISIIHCSSNSDLRKSSTQSCGCVVTWLTQNCQSFSAPRTRRAKRNIWYILCRTRRMASVSAISLRHILWLPHESHAAMSLPSSVADAGIWLRQESLRHILASPVYAPGTIAVNVAWIEKEFNACQTHRSIPIYLQPFLSNSSRKFKSSPFKHIFAHFVSPGHAPGTIAVNVTRL